MNIPSNLYFVGAGGIGMANLVRYFLSKGCRIAGYDRTSTRLTDALRAEGAELVCVYGSSDGDISFCGGYAP